MKNYIFILIYSIQTHLGVGNSSDRYHVTVSTACLNMNYIPISHLKLDMVYVLYLKATLA